MNIEKIRPLGRSGGFLRCSWLVTLGLSLCPSAFANSLSAGQADLARKAQAILKTYCYRCHGQDGAIEGGMNYVLDVKALIRRKKIVPGHPEQSKLFNRLQSKDNPMPPEEEKTRPSQQDIAILAEWIKAGAAEAGSTPPARAPLGEAEIIRLIHNDLQTLEARNRPYARYFTITHLYNANLSDDELQTYRHGLSKLVNSLSWQPDIVVPRAIDPAQTLLRIDLRDYRWNAQVWKRLLEPYPYGVIYATSLARAIYAATDCELPYVRADWFVFAASRPPLYYELLQLPRTDRGLEQDLKLDVAANIREERLARAAFNGSGVSRNNRLIERHKTGYGAYWKSYDFASNTGRQNLFAFPLGPGEGSRAFQQDGGEIIFHLPNGLQAYLLVDGKGNRINEGPIKIVSVKNQADPTVINGISCMLCHARGLIDKSDQIRSHAEKNPGAFSEIEHQLIRALYPPEAEFKTLLNADTERYRKAVAATGTKLGQMEPVVALAGRFETELDLTLAAAEIGLSTAAFLRNLDSSSDFAQRLGALRIEGGTVQRQVFADAFPEMVQAFHLGTSLFNLNKAIARQTEAIERHPNQAPSYFERGKLQFEKGALDQAIADFSEAIRLDFRGSEIYQLRGKVYANKGDFERAIRDYDAALRLEPQSADIYHNRALAHAQKSDFERALADLDEAARLDPQAASVYSDRGLIHAREGAFERAIADYDQAIALQPGSATIYVRRGDAFRARGDEDRAILDYSRALELNPRFQQAYQNRAAVYARQGRYDAAIADYDAVLRLDPRSAAAYLERGTVEASKRDFESAIRDFQAALELDPRLAEAHNGLAWLRAVCPLARLRKGRDAVEHATKACELTDHQKSAFLDTLAAACAECGQFDQAVRWANKAMALASGKDKGAFRTRLQLYEAGKAFRLPESP
jgi:tetratricopeptide (TPR) repeat protein